MCSRLIIAAIGIFLVGYLLQLPTPLRLNPDAVVYVALGASLADGQGLQFYHTASHFPPGLPVLYAGLARAGLLCSAGIVAVNLLFLLLGCVGAVYLLKNAWQLKPALALGAVLLTLASHIFIKHITLPISDVVYFGLSLAALALIVAATRVPSRARGYQLLLAAVLVTATALAVRTVAVTLLPAIAWAILLIHRESLRNVKPAAWMMIGLGILAGVATVAVLALRSLYVQEMLATYSGNGGLLDAIRLIVQYRCRELGELLLNIPGNRLPPRLNRLAPGLGVALLMGLAWAMYRRRRQIGPLEIYLLGFATIMAAWPYSDIRFHAPVVPLIFGLLAATFSPALPWRRLVVGVFMAIFCACGLAAMVYSTALTYSGQRFADRFGDKPEFRAAYRQVFYGAPPPAGVQMDVHVVDVLRRYEKLSRRPD